ncbi:DNA polymerase III subunit gamma/tau domain-containing protein [Nocardiopsis coralliicola]
MLVEASRVRDDDVLELITAAPPQRRASLTFVPTKSAAERGVRRVRRRARIDGRRVEVDLSGLPDGTWVLRWTTGGPLSRVWDPIETADPCFSELDALSYARRHRTRTFTAVRTGGGRLRVRAATARPHAELRTVDADGSGLTVSGFLAYVPEVPPGAAVELVAAAGGAERRLPVLLDGRDFTCTIPAAVFAPGAVLGPAADEAAAVERARPVWTLTVHGAAAAPLPCAVRCDGVADKRHKASFPRCIAALPNGRAVAFRPAFAAGDRLVVRAEPAAPQGAPSAAYATGAEPERHRPAVPTARSDSDPAPAPPRPHRAPEPSAPTRAGSASQPQRAAARTAAASAPGGSASFALPRTLAIRPVAQAVPASPSAPPKGGGSTAAAPAPEAGGAAPGRSAARPAPTARSGPGALGPAAPRRPHPGNLRKDGGSGPAASAAPAQDGASGPAPLAADSGLPGGRPGEHAGSGADGRVEPSALGRAGARPAPTARSRPGAFGPAGPSLQSSDPLQSDRSRSGSAGRAEPAPAARPPEGGGGSPRGGRAGSAPHAGGPPGDGLPPAVPQRGARSERVPPDGRTGPDRTGRDSAGPGRKAGEAGR